MPRYNLAYSPIDPLFSKRCTDFAFDQFGNWADGYCLNSSNSLPHVTLSQFVADETKLDDVWAKATSLTRTEAELSFMGVDLRPGSGFHQGYVFAELAVRPSVELTGFQKNIALMLLDAGIEPLTRSGKNYFPHLTFARLKRVPPASDAIIAASDAWKGAQRFFLSLGLAEDKGAYLEILKPNVQPVPSETRTR